MERSQGEPGTDAFRAELRGWLSDHLTPEVVEAGHRQIEGGSLEVLRAWNRTLADGGWAAPSWPVEHGGRGADVGEQLAYLEETNRVGAPGPVNVIGVSNIAPAIMQFGTTEQKARFLQPMLRGDEIWSQGMSEPDAGSDLASLRTAAVDRRRRLRRSTDRRPGTRSGTWRTGASSTSAPTRRPRSTRGSPASWSTCGRRASRPGRSRPSPAGQTFAELFFTDVRVPRSAMLGPLHQGWSVAMTTLSHERAGVARLHLSLASRLDDLLGDPRARAGLGDPGLRDRLARVFASIRCMRYLTERSLAGSGGGGSGRQPGQAVLGPLRPGAGRPGGGPHRARRARAPATAGPTTCSRVRQASIAGGTTEINKNIVGEHVLGLPR